MALDRKIQLRIQRARTDAEIEDLAKWCTEIDLEDLYLFRQKDGKLMADYILSSPESSYDDERVYKLVVELFRCYKTNPLVYDDVGFFNPLFNHLYDAGVIEAKLDESIVAVRADPLTLPKLTWHVSLYVHFARQKEDFNLAKVIDALQLMRLSSAVRPYFNSTLDKPHGYIALLEIIKPWCEFDLKILSQFKVDEKKGLDALLREQLTHLCLQLFSLCKEQVGKAQKDEAPEDIVQAHKALAWKALNGFNLLPPEVVDSPALLRQRAIFLLSELDVYTKSLADVPRTPLAREGVLEGSAVRSSEDTAFTEEEDDRRQFWRHCQVEGVFFDPRRSRALDAIKAMTVAIIQQRYRTDVGSQGMINLEGKSIRQLIMAEVLYYHTLNRLTPDAERWNGLPKFVERVETDESPRWRGPYEFYCLGETTMKLQLTEPSDQKRFGQVYVHDLGAYSVSRYSSTTILALINKICMNDREKEIQLARLFMSKSCNLSPITEDEIRAINPGFRPLKNDLHKLTRTLLLMLWREPVQWLNVMAAKEPHNGLSVGFALFYQALLAGRVTWGQYMRGAEPEVGIYTYQGLNTKLPRAQAAIKNLIPHADIPAAAPSEEPRRPKVGQKRLRFFMQDAFGGHDETDCEADYDSDGECRPSKR